MPLLLAKGFRKNTKGFLFPEGREKGYSFALVMSQ
jgi:hypothetical protein